MGARKLSTKENQINCIKHQFYSSNESKVQIEMIDALRTYGKQGLNTLTGVINTPGVDNQVKAHGFKTIEDIKKNSLS